MEYFWFDFFFGTSMRRHYSAVSAGTTIFFSQVRLFWPEFSLSLLDVYGLSSLLLASVLRYDDAVKQDIKR
jgi:hypothetical protein